MKLVSIVLPTYNRAAFLPDAFAAIVAQTYQHWELIIVDDGSSDNTQELVQQFQATSNNRIEYVVQKNQGPAVARNKGLSIVTGDYIAFYDSDDIWLPHHLTNCCQVLNNYLDVAWVYGACQRRIKATQEVIQASTFYTNGKANPLFSLQAQQIENLHIINDANAAAMQVVDGIDSGLQNSMLRKEIFEKISIPAFRIGEDRLFIMMALKAGFGFAFIDDIHVHYMVHDNNISNTNVNETNVDKRAQVTLQLIESYEKTPDYIKNLTVSEKQVLNNKIADEYFWMLGYNLQWQHGFKKQALQSFKKGIKHKPFAVKFWKTYLKALLTFMFSK